MEFAHYKTAMQFGKAGANVKLTQRAALYRSLAANALQKLARHHGTTVAYLLANFAFCPTGEGGGIDNSCSPVNKDQTVDLKLAKAAGAFQYNPGDDRARAILTIAANKTAVGQLYSTYHPGEVILYRAGKLGAKKGLSFSRSLAEAKKQLFLGDSVITMFKLTRDDPAIDIAKLTRGSLYEKEQEVFVDIRKIDKNRFKQIKTMSSYGVAAYHLPDQHDQSTHAGERALLGRIKERAFMGRPVAIFRALTKQQQGALGEKIVARLTGGRAVALKDPSFPVDVIAKDTIYEVKTGLVSNGSDAQKWRIAFDTTPDEMEMFSEMTAEQVTAYYVRKLKAVKERKLSLVRQLSEKLGRPIKLKTVGLILDPDRRRVDVHEFDGTREIIRWRSPEAGRAYRGTFRHIWEI